MLSEGNISTESQEFRNWFIGGFREEDSPFKTENFEMKWSPREKGYYAAPKEEGHVDEKGTLGVLVRGKMKFGLVDEGKEIVLEKEGDYYFMSPTTRHSVEALEDSLIITLRW